jgi:hypothetical protein
VWQIVVIAQTGELYYYWGLEDEPGQAPTNVVAYRVILGSSALDVTYEEGSYAGIPPLELFRIARSPGVGYE